MVVFAYGPDADALYRVWSRACVRFRFGRRTSCSATDVRQRASRTTRRASPVTLLSAMS